MATRPKRRARDPALHSIDDPHQLPQTLSPRQPSPPPQSSHPTSLQPPPPPSHLLEELSLSPNPASASEDTNATPQPNRKIKIKLNVTPRPKFPAPRKEDTNTNVPKVCVTSFLSVEQARRIMPGVTAGQLRAAQRRGSASAVVNGVNGSHTSNDEKGKDKDKEEDKSLERNIDNVIFGDVRFKAWYPSWYPKEIIGEKALDGKGVGIVVEELFVCGRCFGYCKVVLEWVKHCRCCEREVPGVEVYRHGGDAGRWAVWEVDGGVETLFCQNLSLFAKLFLDNKSVFFDVAGFNYFLLVYTPPSPSPPQIVGFFSKEKMSWDNNNLACILIFPPWQRKGLGSILMGVSYEISRREEILGGPEKPISDLGKKGYKRYWGAEIARWLLEVRETDRKKGRGMVDVERVSRETWIAGEDCLSVLREMGVVEKAGRGKGSVERVRVDKEAVRRWVEKEKLCLERVVDPEGFVEGYGYRNSGDEEMGD